jgi:hypothetical protein
MTAVPLYPQIRSVDDAENLCQTLESRIDALEAVIREETDLLATAHLRDAFALFDRKLMEAQSYERSLAAFRANSVALARYRPQGLERVKLRRASLETILESNLRTLQTLKSVSENLLRNVAKEVAQKTSLQTYGASGRTGQTVSRKTTVPVLISGKY